MPTHGLRWPYSLLSMVAVMKAVAVWPEGKEWLSLPSGRSTLDVSLMLSTTLPMMAAESAPDAIMRLHELRLSTPAVLRPIITRPGRNCMPSSTWLRYSGR